MLSFLKKNFPIELESGEKNHSINILFVINKDNI